MLIDEPLLKIGVSRAILANPTSLLLQDSIPIQATLDLCDTIQRSFYLRGFPDFTFELLRFCDTSTMFFGREFFSVRI